MWVMILQPFLQRYTIVLPFTNTILQNYSITFSNKWFQKNEKKKSLSLSFTMIANKTIKDTNAKKVIK